MNDIQSYRQSVLDVLLSMTDSNGMPRFSESEAAALLGELSDEDLALGMEFNSPEDVADVICNLP